jgi:hypothetical protein
MRIGFRSIAQGWMMDHHRALDRRIGRLQVWTTTHRPLETDEDALLRRIIAAQASRTTVKDTMTG